MTKNAKLGMWDATSAYRAYKLRSRWSLRASPHAATRDLVYAWTVIQTWQTTEDIKT